MVEACPKQEVVVASDAQAAVEPAEALERVALDHLRCVEHGEGVATAQGEAGVPRHPSVLG